MKKLIIAAFLLLSANYLLIAQIKPNVTLQPSDQTVNEGQAVSFTVHASCDGPLGFQWWAGGSNQWNNGDKGGRLTIVNTANSSTLTITNVNAAEDHNNQFTCEVKNLNGYPASGYWVNSNTAYLTVLSNQFTEQSSISLIGVANSSASWGDYDNDGNLDILLTGGNVDGIHSKIYRNNGDNSFTEQSSISLTGVGHSSAAWGDYDNDGDLDILLTGCINPSIYSSPYSTIYRNNGNNSFSEQTQITLSPVENGSVAWGDYDNDGNLDVLLTGNATNRLAKIHKNNGDNTFTEQSSIVLTGVFDCSTAFGDYDSDGDLDIVLTGASESGNIAKIYRNNGNNTYTEQTSIVLSPVKLSTVVWGDYDSDGDLDLLLSGHGNSGYVSKIYKNNGNNGFTDLASITLPGLRGSAAAWGDYDNDGDLDFVLTGITIGGTTFTKIYKNNGNDSFTEQSSILLAQVFAGAVAWGDYDNDGDLDLLLTGSNGSQSVSKIYLNNIISPNTVPSTPSNLSSIVIGQDVTISWNKSTDNETPQEGLKYNIVIGTSANGFDKLSPMSERNTGFRKVVDLGNANHNNSWTIKGLPNGVYYWSVQAIDNNFAGSNFAPEQTFSVGPPIISWLDTLKITDNGNENGNLIYGQSFFGTDTIDLLLGEATLPPTPPVSVFDVRFELPTDPSDFSLTDFRDDTLKAREWLLEFQPGIGGYPITFTWEPASLPSGLFFLKDLVTGTIVNVNMKENSSYTLTNSGITSLKIEYSVVPITWDASVIIKDNGNILQGLKFGQSTMGTEGIDNALGELPLPPPPPTGSFDARFELPVIPLDYSFIDFRNDTSQSVTWLLKFQPGNGGYPITFIWNPDELPEGFFFLKDNVTGTIVNVNMKLVNSYTLTNTGITSLKIEYSQQVCLNLNLNQGWNIISVPAEASDMNTQTLFPDYSSPTYTYNNGYQPVVVLENGLGYWIRYNNTSLVTICGTQAGGTTIPVHAGWNIVGGYGQDIPVSSISTTPQGILTSPFYGFNNGYIQPSSLQVGNGYWIRASQNGLINISNTTGKSSSLSMNTSIDPSWGKIIITDREGRQGVIYLAVGNVDLMNYELPPTPPAGIFDIRSSNNRTVELSNALNEIVISSAAYPIIVRAEGIDIGVKDAFTGTIINKAIKNGQGITIEDNTVNKLTIGQVDIPSEYSLYQNYPNPFNPSTTIKFGLPNNSNVSLTIYNQLGEKIDVLLDQAMEAGYHTVNWNASNLASGLYFYELKTEKYNSVKKLLLMK